MSYIERETALNVIADIMQDCKVVHKHRALNRNIKQIPTADVVKVKHGTWLSVEGDVIFKCSICEAEVSTSWNYENDNMFTYCPCCGAKMDGERSENGT